LAADLSTDSVDLVSDLVYLPLSLTDLVSAGFSSSFLTPAIWPLESIFISILVSLSFFGF
jgi:hypothetical protein